MRSSSRLPLLLLAAALGAGWPKDVPPAGEARPIDQRYWVVIPAAGRDERTKIAEAGISIEEVTASSVGGVADARQLERLAARGIVPARRTALEGSHPKAFPMPDAAFHDYGEVAAELGAIAQAAPDLATVFSIGASLEGRDLLALRLNSSAKGNASSEKPGALFLGTHHAREHLSTEVPLALARWLVDHRARPDVKRLLETRDVYFIPLVNPDGAEYDHADCRPDGVSAGCRYKWHRKNLRRNPDGSLGVDLNRNYGYGWGGGGTSDDPRSDIYRGPQAFSEPETRAVRAFVEARPNLRVLLTYHTFMELILYPWGHTTEAIADGKALAAYRNMAAAMAGMTGYTPEQASELYVASGDTTDWAWGTRKIFSFTFELTPRSMAEGGFYPGSAAIGPTVAKNVEPMLYLIGLADDPYRAAGGDPGAPPPGAGPADVSE